MIPEFWLVAWANALLALMRTLTAHLLMSMTYRVIE